ncbi:MAG: choice-of-anchor D domain-containing protein [Planctomycetota bacterium]
MKRSDYRGFRGFRAALCVVVLSGGFLLLPSSAHAIKIVTYNLLNYAGTSTCDDLREPHFRTVLNAIDAAGDLDIICVQEVTNDTSGQVRFLIDVLNHASGPGGYTAAPFLNGSGGGGDNAMYYRADKIEWLGGATIPTAGAGGIRDWTYHKVGLVGYDTEAAELHIFIAHLSSSGGASQREIEADVYRDWAEANLPDGAHVICCGDFNLEGSSEGAWTRFTETRATNIGRLQDPANRVGWWHLSSSYADVHTQAPQAAGQLSCTNFVCSYSGGGMDDRFDFLLTSGPLHDAVYPYPGDMEFFSGRYKAYGNDALHYDDAINDLPVIPEGQAVADALACASDHLPVVIEVMAPSLLEFISPIDFGQAIVGADVERTLTVENTAPFPAQVLRYSIVYPTAFSGGTGPFSEPSGGGGTNHTITFSSLTSGNLGGTLRVCNNSPDCPTCPDCPGQWCRSVALQGWMLDHAVPSTSSSGQVLTADLDFGMHLAGDFDDQTATVYNDDYNLFQSALEVYDAQITGDSEFSVLAFQPPDPPVGDTPASFTVQFDDAGTAAGIYSAALTFSTRDDTSLPGAIDLDALVFNLSATLVVKGDMDMSNVVDSVDIAAFIAVLLDPAGKTDLERFIADMDGDGFNNGDDIQPFVSTLLGLP